MFRFLIFRPFFQGGVTWPHLPLCADAHVHGSNATDGQRWPTCCWRCWLDECFGGPSAATYASQHRPKLATRSTQPALLRVARLCAGSRCLPAALRGRVALLGGRRQQRPLLRVAALLDEVALVQAGLGDGPVAGRQAPDLLLEEVRGGHVQGPPVLLEHHLVGGHPQTGRQEHQHPTLTHRFLHLGVLTQSQRRS